MHHRKCQDEDIDVCPCFIVGEQRGREKHHLIDGEKNCKWCNDVHTIGKEEGIKIGERQGRELERKSWTKYLNKQISKTERGRKVLNTIRADALEEEKERHNKWCDACFYDRYCAMAHAIKETEEAMKKRGERENET